MYRGRVNLEMPMGRAEVADRRSGPTPNKVAASKESNDANSDITLAAAGA
jgi:hypothetical protein